MDEKQLQYYSVLYETKNITKAADQLYISRTGLSLSMKKLENELGLPLFYRKTGGVEPTEYGTVFYHAVIAQRQIMSDCLQKLKEMKATTTEVIRIGVLANTLTSSMIRHIFLFEQIYSSVTIDIMDNGAIHYFDALKKGDIDIAFAVCPPRNLGLCSTRLMDSEQVLLISRKHPLAARKSIDFTCDLRGQTLLEAECRMDAHQELLNSFGIQCKHVSGDCQLLQEMLRHGKGCVLTLPSLAPLYANDQISILPIVNIPASLNLNAHLVYRPDSSQNILNLVKYICNLSEF